MAKNIIICCDGTGNQFGEENSNVVKLFSVLEKRSLDQIMYYNPGVGTMSDKGLKTSFGKKISIFQGLVFGRGLTRNITNAYSYLMENYEDGDKVFLFGFSRGAYTVKVLASFIHMNGLLMKGCQNLIPYSWELFQSKEFGLATKFKHNYSRFVPIHFIGVWDAVSSIGWVTRRKTYPFTFKNPSISIIRHAVSIDERRAYYEANLFDDNKENKTDVKQVWFAGVHSDVGGSYPEPESGLSKIALQWMINESIKFGLKINTDRYKRIVLGIETTGKYIAPDFNSKVHKSLNGLWWLLEILPKNHTLNRSKYSFPFGKRRTIPEGAFIHPSVIEKINTGNYKVSNLPQKYHIWSDL